MGNAHDREALDDALALLAERYSLDARPEIIGRDANDHVVVRVGRRRLLIVPAHLGFEAIEDGQAGRGRPQVVPRESAQRQYVACARQLAWLKQRLTAAQQKRPRFTEHPWILKTQLDALDARIAKDRRRQRERFWLRTLRLGLVSTKEVLAADPVLPKTSALVFERADDTLVRLRRSDDERLYVLSDSKPIERWPSFMTGDFLPSVVALRVLSVFYKLEFDFLKAGYEDHDLFIRKAVYPLQSKWRKAIRRIGGMS